MDVQKFKEEGNRTYVGIYAKGRISSIHNGKGGNDGCRVYSGYIEVPYSHKDFADFSEKQQKAICQAELCKTGWHYEFINFSIDVNAFYSEHVRSNENEEKDFPANDEVEVEKDEEDLMWEEFFAEDKEAEETKYSEE